MADLLETPEAEASGDAAKNWAGYGGQLFLVGTVFTVAMAFARPAGRYLSRQIGSMTGFSNDAGTNIQVGR